MDKLYVIIPAYNEEANIEQVIKQWYPVVEDYNGQMVIIDDGSTDRTYEILRHKEKECPLLTAISKKNGGHGATILYGYRYALEHHADYIFQTDSDGQTLPEEFEAFWENRRKFDMVIGFRKHREDGLSRIVVTRVLRVVTGVCFRVRIPDANTPYRLMKSQTLARYIHLIPEEFNLTNVLISVILVKKGCRVKWLPVTFRARQGGENSMNMKRIFKIGLQALIDFRRMNQILQRKGECIEKDGV